MLHAAPTSETAQSKTQPVPQPERELHPHLSRPAGLYSSGGMNGTAFGISPTVQLRPAFAGMQSAHGNQAVLRMMRSPQQVMRMTPLRPSQGMMLQRKCACGGSSEAGGECAECKAKHEEGHDEPVAIQTKLQVNQPGDQYEQEADRVSDQVMRMAIPEASITPNGNKALVRQVKNASAGSTTSAPPIVNEVVSSHGGQPLDEGTRTFMEPRFGHDFSGVRVHTDAKAAESARAVNALAYTVGRDVVFGDGQYAPGTSEGRRLMAHELTHVVQQQAPVLQAFTAGSFSQVSTTENQQSAIEPVTIHRRTDNQQVQKEDQPKEQKKIWWEDIVDFAGDQIWALVKEFAPELEPVLRMGVFDWLNKQISLAIETLVNQLMEPIHEVKDVTQWLSTHFAKLLVWIQDAAIKLAHGDCSALIEASEKIQQVVSNIVTPIVDRVQALTEKVKNFFTDLWDSFGTPVWDWLKKIGGEVWEKIQQLGNWIWEKTAPIRDKVSSAWTWIKNKLGIGEGPEGQNGILQWVQENASKVWESIKQKIEPIKKPLMTTVGVVGGIIIMCSPAGPFVIIGAEIAGLVKGISWIRQHLNTPDGVVLNRETLQKVIIPEIINKIHSFTGKLANAAGMISQKLKNIMESLGQVTTIVSTSIISFAVKAVQWIADQFQKLVDWATDGLMEFVNWVSEGLEHLLHFLQPVLDILKEIGDVILDIFKLPSLILGKLWHMIPACIRDPFVDFLVNHILKHIPIFNKLLALPDIWNKIKARAMEIIHNVFKEGDLQGAIILVFKLTLDAVGIPLELVTGIFTKAANALDLIVKDPLGFLKNLLGAVKKGFINFFRNIGPHLLSGVADWLFGELLEKGIHRPADFSFKSIFMFIMEILGISTESIFEKLEKKIGFEKVQMLKKATRMIGQAWDWITDLLVDGPAGLWRKLTTKLSNLWQMLLSTIINWVSKNIFTAMAEQLKSLLDPTGAMEVIQSIIDTYRMIKSAVKYAEKILRIFNTILDTLVSIASGNLAPAAQMLEDALDKALPVVIGFLADQVELDDIGDKIKNMVDVVRHKVDEALDWLIDTAIAMGGAVLGMLGLRGREEEKPESQGRLVGVKEQASILLLEKLQGGGENGIGDAHRHTKSQVQEIVKQVFVQLQPQGLKSLEIGPESDDGSYAILAEASPIDPVVLMRLARQNAQVKLVATLTFRSPQALTTARTFKSAHLPGTDIRVASVADTAALVHPESTLEIDKRAKEKSKDEKESEKVTSSVIQMVSWNAGNPDKMLDSNTTHAEVQFMSWFESDINDQTLSQLEKIELLISESPCTFCAYDLEKFMKRKRVVSNFLMEESVYTTLKELVENHKLQFGLEYERPHTTGKHPTTKEDIEKLKESGIRPIWGKEITLTKAAVEANPRYAVAPSIVGQYTQAISRGKG